MNNGTSSGTENEKRPLIDGAAGSALKKKRLHMMYCGLAISYVILGMLAYYIAEGWDPLESTVFTLSIVTGVGYGHVAPASAAGMAFSTVFILAGLILFASIAGQVLDFLMQGEIDAVMDAVRDTQEGGDNGKAKQGYHDRVQKRKKRHFIVGSINLGVLSFLGVLVMKMFFAEDWVHAFYLSAISVLKLDSICLLDGVTCHADRGSSNAGWLIFAIIWYVLTYSVIGHFLVSASNYLGVDPDSTLSKVQVLTGERIERMDADGDGKVSRSEFLRDRLIQDGRCSKEAVDAILHNFDALDKNKSGILSKRDLAQQA